MSVRFFLRSLMEMPMVVAATTGRAGASGKGLFVGASKFAMRSRRTETKYPIT